MYQVEICVKATWQAAPRQRKATGQDSKGDKGTGYPGVDLEVAGAEAMRATLHQRMGVKRGAPMLT